MEAIYAASRRGNYPLMRCYSGTRNLLKWAAMNVKNFNNGRGVIPLCWYSVMAGRSQRSLAEPSLKTDKPCVGMPKEIARWK